MSGRFVNLLTLSERIVWPAPAGVSTETRNWPLMAPRCRAVVSIQLPMICRRAPVSGCSLTAARQSNSASSDRGPAATGHWTSPADPPHRAAGHGRGTPRLVYPRALPERARVGPRADHGQRRGAV